MTSQIAVIGCGHVGLVMAAGLAELGNTVVGIDRSPSLVGALCSGDVPIREDGLAELRRPRPPERPPHVHDLI